MRHKYRSAIYCFDEGRHEAAENALKGSQADFPELVITELLRFGQFRLNKPEYPNYYFHITNLYREMLG